MKDFIEKCKDRFYSEYLLYTALESELLFFVVCDAIFLTQVKKLTLEQISEITFLSLIFSLLVQYPLLKFVHRAGNSISLRLGSIVFAVSHLHHLCAKLCYGFGRRIPEVHRQYVRRRGTGDYEKTSGRAWLRESICFLSV